MAEERRQEGVTEEQAEQTAPPQTGGTLPPQVVQVAQTAHLGAGGVVHENEATRKEQDKKLPAGPYLFWSVLGLFSIILIWSGVALLRNPDPDVASGGWVGIGVGMLIGILFLVGLLLGLFASRQERLSSARQERLLSVFVFPGGLVLLWKKRAPEALPWQQMATVTRQVGGGESLPVIGGYTVERADSPMFSFTTREFPQLGGVLEEALVHSRLSQVVADYQAGIPVVFGPVSISQQGITAAGKMLPWSEISQVQLEETCLKMRKRPADLLWYEGSSNQFPNAPLLQGLVNSILRRQPGAGG